MTTLNFDDVPETMDIYSPPGTKVVFKFPDNGSKCDSDSSKVYLKLLEVYTVNRIWVYQYSSSVELKEHPKMVFNTAHFANIKLGES